MSAAGWLTDFKLWQRAKKLRNTIEDSQYILALLQKFSGEQPGYSDSNDDDWGADLCNCHFDKLWLLDEGWIRVA